MCTGRRVLAYLPVTCVSCGRNTILLWWWLLAVIKACSFDFADSFVYTPSSQGESQCDWNPTLTFFAVSHSLTFTWNKMRPSWVLLQPRQGRELSAADTMRDRQWRREYSDVCYCVPRCHFWPGYLPLAKSSVSSLSLGPGSKPNFKSFSPKNILVLVTPSFFLICFFGWNFWVALGPYLFGGVNGTQCNCARTGTVLSSNSLLRFFCNCFVFIGCSIVLDCIIYFRCMCMCWGRHASVAVCEWA